MPGLSLPALRKQIADRRLGPVYLLVGEDLKLIDRMVDAIETVVDEGDRAFAIERLYAGDEGGDPVDIAAAARTMPMLGDRRIVFVLRAERLLKPKRTAKAPREPVPDDEGDTTAGEPEQAMDAVALEEYLEAPLPSTTLVFVATDIDRGRRLTKRLLEKSQWVEFRGLADAGGTDGRGGAVAWLREELTRAGREAEPEAARMLLTRSGGDITKLRGDVERIMLFTQGRPKITADDVREVVSEQFASDDDWALTNAIAAGQAARALAETGVRLERGDSPHAMLGQLRWWVSNKMAGSAPESTRAAIEALLRTDLALKSSGGDDRVLLERLVVELSALKA